MENKTKRLEIRLTESENQQLLEAATIAGLSVSSYVRRKTLQGELGVMDSFEFVKLYNQYLYELRKIGNNINQLAHYANILLANDVYSEDVVKEMTNQLRALTTVQMRIEDIENRFIKKL